MNRGTVKATGIAYVVVLAVVIIAGILAFRDLYGAARPLPGTEFAPHYQSFLTVAGGFLALYLGCWAGLLGVVYHRWLLGAAGVVVGAGLTVAGFSALPWVLFPIDQYAAGAMWVFLGLPLCVGAWAVITASGAIRRWRV